MAGTAFGIGNSKIVTISNICHKVIVTISDNQCTYFLHLSSAYGPGAGSTNATARYLCNHRRAYKLFTNSISPKCSSFVAFPCESYEKSVQYRVGQKSCPM